jgi:hypothetical protein
MANLQLKPEDISKNYKTLTPAQLEYAISDTVLATTLLSIINKLSDEQLRSVAPFMTLDQVALYPFFLFLFE